MTIRRGSWDSFADHIRWSRPPAPRPIPAASAQSARATQAEPGQQASHSPRGSGPAAGHQAEEPGLKRWLQQLLKRLLA